MTRRKLYSIEIYKCKDCPFSGSCSYEKLGEIPEECELKDA